jgi:hypothetical protein
MPQATDGTQLNVGVAGDLVSDEDLTGQPRGTSAVPQLGAPNAGYKVERTKIAIGDYGQDAGDAAAATGLPVRTLFERQALEEIVIRETQNGMNALADARGRSGSRGSVLDARGGSYRGSTR